VHYRSLDGEREIIQAPLGARVTEDIAAHVTTIVGVSDFHMPQSMTPHGRRRLSDRESLAARNPTDPLITPALLKQAYGVNPNLTATQSLNRQGVLALEDYYSTQALTAFQQTYNLSGVTITDRGNASCLPTCGATESDLDIQYITAMGKYLQPFSRVN